MSWLSFSLRYMKSSSWDTLTFGAGQSWDPFMISPLLSMTATTAMLATEAISPLSCRATASVPNKRRKSREFWGGAASTIALTSSKILSMARFDAEISRPTTIARSVCSRPAASSASARRPKIVSAMATAANSPRPIDSQTGRGNAPAVIDFVTIRPRGRAFALRIREAIAGCALKQLGLGFRRLGKPRRDGAIGAPRRPRFAIPAGTDGRGRRRGCAPRGKRTPIPPALV